MTANEALGRLVNACGDHVVDDVACWEIEALKREGWKASMILGNATITIVLEEPSKKSDD
jgi:hypothetical protein